MAEARRTTLRFNVDVNNKELTAVNKQFDEAIKTGKQFDDTLKNQIKTTKELTSTANKLEDAIYKETGALTALAKKKAEAIKLHGQESDEVKKLDKQIKDTAKTQSDYRKELDETHKKLAHSTEIEKGIKNLKEYDKANQEGIKSLKEKGRAHDAERKQLESLSGQIEQHTGILEREKQELNRLGKQYGEHDDRVIASAKNYDALKHKQQGLEREFGSLGDTIGRQNPKLMRWSDNLSQMSVKLDTASKKFGKTGESMKQFGSDITSTFGAAALGGGVAITYAVKKAADFEQGMKDTEALMSQEEWAKDGSKLTELVKQQGAATKYSSVEAALGLQELVKAGVSTSDILNGGLKDGLNLATAGELDLAKASETMSTALNSFTGDTSLTATKAANLLAGAANASATDVEGMSYALSQSAAVANTVGQDFEATATTLAMLAQNGLKGSDAGTSLKTMLLNLSPQTDAAARQMESLGLAQLSTTNGYMYLMKRGIEPASKSYDDIKTSLQELAVVSAGEGANASKIKKEYEKLEKQSGLVSSAFYDQAGNVKGLDEISRLLQKSLQGLTKEQQQNAMKTMFGTDAVRAAAIMAKEGAKGYDAMNTAMSEVTAADVAKQKMDTLKGAIEYATGSMETLTTELGTALIPVVKDGAKAIEKTADWFGSLNDETKETIAKWGLIGTVGATLITGFGLVAIAAGGVITGLSRIARASSSMFGWLSRKSTALGTSKLALDVETSALNRNTIAQQRNNASRGGVVTTGGKGGTVVAKGGKGKASKGALTTVVTTGKDGLGKVGKNGLLKNGVNMGKSGGALKGAARLGKGVPILGTVLGAGMLVAGGLDNLGANAGGLLGGIGGGAAAGAVVGTVAGPVGTAIGAAIGAVGGAIGGEKFGAYLQKSIKKHWPKDSLKSTIGNDVSKDTKTAVKAYEKLNTSATNELHSLSWSSTKITKSNTKSLKTAYSDMGNSITSSLKKNVKRANKEISALDVGGTLTSGEKKNILTDIKTHYSKIEKETEKSQKKINKILNKASKEKRALTEEETAAIEKEQENMRKNSVKTLSKSAKEQRTIMSQLKADASGISAKQAVAVVKNSKKARDGSVKEAEKKYKDTIAMADKEFYDNKSISKAQYDAIIESAKKTKKDSIDNAEEMHNKVVKQAKLQASGQVDQVNWSTGEMLGKWAKFKNGLASVVNSISKGINSVLDAFGVDSKIPMWGANPTAKGKTSGTASKSTTINNQGNSIASFAKGGYHTGGPAVVGEEGPELTYTPYGNARLVGQNGAEIANLESGTRILTASQTKQMMSGGLSGQMPGYASGIGGNIKDAINTVGNGVKTVTNKVTDTASDVYNGAKDIASSAIDFVTDPGSAIDKIIGKTKLGDVAGLGKAALSKVKDGAVSFVTDKLSMFGGGGGGPITNSYGVYDSLLSIAQTIMSSPLGKGLSITSGHREGDPHDHGKHNAIDLSGFGRNGGYLNVAKWASKLPGVSYAIGDDTVFGRKYGDGKRPGWAKGHMNHLHVSGNGEGGGATSGSAQSWSSVIKSAAKKMKVDLSDSELSGIIAQINRESTGNQNVIQSSAVKDINTANGNPAKGLLQYVPETFKRYALKGNNNIFSGMDQLLAFFNNSSWRSDLPYGRSGWGPSGKRRFATGGWKNVKGQVLVGEEGPELVDLPQGSHINNNNRTNDILKKNSGGNTINFSPQISISIEGTQSDSVASQVQKAVDEAMKRAFKEFTAMFDSGVAY